MKGTNMHWRPAADPLEGPGVWPLTEVAPMRWKAAAHDQSTRRISILPSDARHQAARPYNPRVVLVMPATMGLRFDNQHHVGIAD